MRCIRSTTVVSTLRRVIVLSLPVRVWNIALKIFVDYHDVFVSLQEA